MQKNPYLTGDEIGEQLGVSTSTVVRATKKLKDLGIVNRIGSNKIGYWEVNL